MVARPWKIISLILSVLLTIWVWTLAIFLFSVRWNSFDHPGPPIYELFPYGELRIGVDASYPPFAVATADDLFGLDIDLGRALGERLGIPVRFVNMGFDGLYDSIRADQVDMVISALHVESFRMDEVRYTRAYFNAGLVLVSNADSPIKGMDSIAGRALAYEFGSEADAQSRLWSRRIAAFETQPYELPEYALDAVRLGIADATLVDAVSFRLYRRDYPDWNHHATYVTNDHYAVAIRIDRWEMWQTVNVALKAIAKDGTLEAILRRWL
jgi:ABC-type amino acid transport substrate-binding protein